MKMHSTNHHDKVLGFGLLILSGAIMMAAFSGMTLMGYLIGVLETLVVATIVGGGGDADW